VVRTPHDAHAALVDESPHALHLAVPPGRAHDGGHTDGAEPLEIRHRRVGRRKLDGHIHSAEIFGCDPLLIDVRVDVQLQADRKACLWRELIDQPAHFSVSDDGEVPTHDELPRGLKASESSAYTYRRR